MFEQLVNETASRFGLSIGSASTLLRDLLSLMTNERTGGEGFADLFRRAGLGDILTSWFGGKEGRPITPSHVESALGIGTLDRLADSSGLSRATVSSALAFMLPKLIGVLTPNGMLPARSALRSRVASYLERPASPVEPRIGMEPERRGWGWLPWAAAAVLAVVALLWLLRTPAGTIDPELTLTNRDGRITYSGVVRDDATRTAVVSALRTAFGGANVQGDLRVDHNVKRAAWLPRLDDLFASLKTPGVQFSLKGDAIGLGGWVSAADREAISDRLRTILGGQVAVSSLGDAAADAVRDANVKALSALGAIGTSGVTPDALVKAMNLAVINFPSGSADIPADGLEIIRKSADAITRAPKGSTIEIGGHTDSSGDPAANLTLSQARANAVKAALVTAGVPAAMLTTKGYGDTRPRASNDTEYGRFQNRRIEYAVVQ
jgi:outer membrane protein OmpA-like peptidoglycan-associated protein/uncharacterized protein YidB (DUF937 family)